MKVFIIEGNTNPHLKGLHSLLTQAIDFIDESAMKDIVISKLPYNTVVKKLQEGKLKGMENDMKISKSIFFHFYTPDNNKEVVIQLSDDKLAVYYDED